MELFYSGDLEMENKYQEALRRIAFNYGLSALDGDTNEIMDDNFNEDMRAIKELVDKEIPMKPIDINGGKYCGRCKQGLIIVSFRLNSCHNLDCRQVVDWSDDNE